MTNKKILIYIFILSLSIRIISVYLTPIKWWDETVYSNLGYDLKTNPFDYSFNRTWSDKNLDWPKAGYKAPLLPYSLSLFYLVFGDGNILIDLFMPVIGSLGILFLFLLVEKMYDEKIALYSSIFLMFLPIHEIISGRILTDVFVTTLITLSFLFFWLGFENKKHKFKIACGFTSAISTLARYSAILLPLIFFVYLLIKNRNLKFLMEKYTILSIIVFILTLFPLFWYGYKTYGTPIGAFEHSSKAMTYYGGIQPWYFYFTNSWSFSILIMVSLFGLFVILKNWSSKLKNSNILFLLWFFLFLLLSIYFPHKEDRFILPLTPALTTVAAIGLAKIKHGKLISILILIILIFTTFIEFKHLSENSYTKEAFCFLEANKFLRKIESNSITLTDSSSLVYFYTRKENHFFRDKFNDNIKLLNEYYSGRPAYILLSVYESPREDFIEELKDSSNFTIVFKCPENGSLAVVYKYL